MGPLDKPTVRIALFLTLPFHSVPPYLSNFFNLPQITFS